MQFGCAVSVKGPVTMKAAKLALALCAALGTAQIATPGLAQGAEPLPACRIGRLGAEQVRLCPEYDAAGQRVWRIVDRRPLPTRAAPRPSGGWYDPAYQRGLPPPPPAQAQREAAPASGGGWSPRVRPRVGVGINSDGDVGVGAGVGVGLGILDLGVSFFD